jgi:maltooligosyltrehalose trehalohydrolase
MRLPVGVTLDGEGGAFARVWAPDERRVELVLEERTARRTVGLEPQADGYFAATVPRASAGALYRFRLGEDAELFADPASRYQPDGPLGSSCIVEPRAFSWSDGDWRGCRLDGRVLYEMHVGTFTPEGTWDAARAKLSLLADLGVGVVEVMPVADFVGGFGWGYDGVCLFAPTRLYGTPDDLRRFVAAAHGHGIGVILDVVYNHLGPRGSTLARFSPHYISTHHGTEWGAGLNYDGPRSGPVRELVLANAAYWIDEFHLDGLRLDATQSIFDDSEDHILGAIVRAVREAARGRDTIVIGENEPQDARTVRPRERGGYGMDGVWNDDFHHTARVALTGLREAYYQDYRGAPQELLSAVKHGFLYQGQRYAWQARRRGTPALDLPPHRLVVFLENHDQVANSAGGRRIHELASVGSHRAMVAAMVLAPATPMLFQGEEFRSSAPFTYFADHDGALGAAVAEGRRAFLAQFPSIAAAIDHLAARPNLRATFEECKLDWREHQANAAWVALYRDLIALRMGDPTLGGSVRRPVDGAVIGAEAFALRYFGEDPGGARDRVLVINLGARRLEPSEPEPLLAPPNGRGWRLLWSSEDPAYGGGGTPHVDEDGAYALPGHAAVLLAPAEGGAS